MPQLSLDLNAHELALLETVRLQQGLQTVDQAAEWLIKQRLRQAGSSLTGRNRALYSVNNKYES